MRCVQALVPMVLDAASAAAVEGVLRTKRGVRTLFEPVVAALLAYFKAKDLGVATFRWIRRRPPLMWRTGRRSGRTTPRMRV